MPGLYAIGDVAAWHDPHLDRHVRREHWSTASEHAMALAHLLVGAEPPAFVQKLAEEIDAELVAMGSAGVKVMSVVRDLTDAYVHAGGQYEWDSAAPVAVAGAAAPAAAKSSGSRLRRSSGSPGAAGSGGEAAAVGTVGRRRDARRRTGAPAK